MNHTQRLSVFILISLLAVGTLLQVMLSVPPVSAQFATPSQGDYGYTYNINPPGQATSVYNVLGRVNFVSSGGPYGASWFQTYVSRQSGPTISSFERLALTGKIWTLLENGCPLDPLINLESRDQARYNTDGALGKEVLVIPNFFAPPMTTMNGNRMAVGRHRIVHPYTTNLSGNTPGRFFVKIGDSYFNPPSTLANYNGIGILGC